MATNAEPGSHQRERRQDEACHLQQVAPPAVTKRRLLRAVIQQRRELTDWPHDDALVGVILVVVHDAAGHLGIGRPLPRVAAAAVVKLPLHRVHGDGLGRHEGVGIVLGLLELGELLAREALLLHERPQRHRAAVGPGFFAVPNIEHVPELLLIRRIARHDVGAGEPGEFVRTGTQFAGQSQRLMPVGMAAVQIPLVQEHQPRQDHQADDGSERREQETLCGVHGTRERKSLPKGITSGSLVPVFLDSDGRGYNPHNRCDPFGNSCHTTAWLRPHRGIDDH